MSSKLTVFCSFLAVTLLTGCYSREELIRRNIDESNRIHKHSIDSTVASITCPELNTVPTEENIGVRAKSTSKYGFSDKRNRFGRYDRYDYRSTATTTVRLKCKRQ